MIRMLLALLVLLLPATARAEWWRAETDHFIIYSEDKKASTEQFAVELERFDNALRTLQAAGRCGQGLIVGQFELTSGTKPPTMR